MYWAIFILLYEKQMVENKVMVNIGGRFASRIRTPATVAT